MKPATKSNVTSSFKKAVKKASSTLKFQPPTTKPGPLGDGSAISTTQSQVLCPSLPDDSFTTPKSATTSDNHLLTTELISLTRELTRLKSDVRLKDEQLKKGERERQELKRAVEGKEAAIERMRREKDELWAVVNTDKYKNIRAIE